MVGRLQAGLARLNDLVVPTAGGSLSGGREVRLLGPRTEAGQAHAAVVQQVNDLHGYLTDDIYHAIDRAKGRHDRSLIAAGGATAVASVLLGTLLYYFRVWVFSPVRQLQAGVRRVRAGEFDRPIRLASDDELAELGAEFDAMTARLRDVYADLRNQVNERTKQLVRSEKMVSVGFLAAGVAHEINNPLASIAFCAEALEGRLTTLLARAPAAESEVVLKYLRMMQDEAQRCKQITQKLLDFSRSGGRREPADLAQLVQDVVEVAELTPTARGKAIEFAPAEPVMAAVSVPDVKGVVLNLIVNALDSMDEGGRLTVRLGVRGEFAELQFADTGCGMTAETLDNIFEPFFTRSKTGQGTGLGLSISHQIIDQHGGTVAAASPGPGRGSTFTVRLPLRAGGPATLPFPARAAAAAA
jgi:signal transduction histidine kinase